MKNPRIHVTLPEDLSEAIGTISHLSDMSKSAFIAHVLTEQKSVIIQIADMMREAQEVSKDLPLSAKLSIDIQGGRVLKSGDDARKALDAVHVLVSDYRNQGQASERESDSTSGRTPDRPLAINKGARNEGGKGVKPELSGDWKDI